MSNVSVPGGRPVSRGIVYICLYALWVSMGCSILDPKLGGVGRQPRRALRAGHEDHEGPSWALTRVDSRVATARQACWQQSAGARSPRPTCPGCLGAAV